MKNRLYNEALDYLSVNTRQLGLYKDIMSEVDILEEVLESKCE
jgi:hypothetical protein